MGRASSGRWDLEAGWKLHEGGGGGEEHEAGGQVEGAKVSSGQSEREVGERREGIFWGTSAFLCCLPPLGFKWQDQEHLLIFGPYLLHSSKRIHLPGPGDPLVPWMSKVSSFTYHRSVKIMSWGSNIPVSYASVTILWSFEK